MTMAAGNLWLALTVTVLTTTTVHGQSWKKERCDQLGLDYLSEISQPTCFSSAKLGEGPVSAEVAQNLCLEYEFGELPSLESKVSVKFDVAHFMRPFSYFLICSNPFRHNLLI